jgi:hypothetical protein
VEGSNSGGPSRSSKTVPSRNRMNNSRGTTGKTPDPNGAVRNAPKPPAGGNLDLPDDPG